ncbi:MAG: hypothetical protein JXA14_01995 [Anaerolineae bacterium]|nr:hypothetical protein [Anaerolineae bacterium]
MPNVRWLLIAVGIAGGVFLIIRFGKALGRLLLVLLGAGVVAALVWAVGAQARATEQVAKAANQAASAQVYSNAAMLVRAGVFALIALGITVLVLVYGLRCRHGVTQIHRVPYGPEAIASPAHDRDIFQHNQEILGQLMQLELLRLLASLSTGAPPQAHRLLLSREFEDDVGEPEEIPYVDVWEW